LDKIRFGKTFWRANEYFGLNTNVIRSKNEPPSTVAKRLARHFTFGRSRVLTPVPPDQVWVFFRGFPTPSHRGMSHITDKANAGSVPTTFLSAPILTVPIPSVWLKRLWEASAARPTSGGTKDVSFLSKDVVLCAEAGNLAARMSDSETNLLKFELGI
jgi:hypothetical protein